MLCGLLYVRVASRRENALAQPLVEKSEPAGWEAQRTEAEQSRGEIRNTPQLCSPHTLS
jgi:hypothetical protein